MSSSTTASSCNCVPSPVPPYARPVNTPVTQTLQEDGVVSLTADPTFLDRLISTPSAPISITIPDGNWIGQSKEIYVPSDKLATSERFVLSGNFAGFLQLGFDGNYHNAVLRWTGTRWVLIGGGPEQIT